MKILTVANRKGGAGKSTCAAHLSMEAVANNLKTILIDLDPQKTLENWWQKREEENPYLIDTTTSDLENTLKKLEEKGFDLCIIDTPGDTSLNAVAGIKIANIVIIPSKPTAPDLAAIGRTINMVEESQKSFAFIITQAIFGAKATLQAASVLSKFGVVAPSVISIRTSYTNAMGTGGSAALIDKKAAAEISQIWAFVKEILFEPVSKTKKKLIA